MQNCLLPVIEQGTLQFDANATLYSVVQLVEGWFLNRRNLKPIWGQPPNSITYESFFEPLHNSLFRSTLEAYIRLQTTHLLCMRYWK